MAEFSVLILTANPPGFGSEGAGAFVKVDGREALLRSVELFLNRDEIKQIQLVIAPDAVEESKRKFGAHLGFSGVKLISGGPRWIEQITAGAAGITAAITHVVLHDAARPVVPFSDIDSLLAEAPRHPAVALAAPVRTQLIEIEEQAPVAVHPPSRFMQLLMPQVFSIARFRQMAEKKSEPHASEWRLLPGSALNQRITTTADAGMSKTLIGMLPKPKLKGPASPFDEAQW